MRVAKVSGTVVIPVLNEAATIIPMLRTLRGQLDEHWRVVLVDGGSQDGTAQLAVMPGVEVIASLPGRAVQMNAGAAHAEGDVLVFLHADTQLPQDFLTQMQCFLDAGSLWGRFDVNLAGASRWYKLIGWMMNQRSRLTGIATGDQTLFMQRSFFQRLNGFAEIPLMEDIEFSRRACRLQPPYCCHARVTTSVRKWETHGIVRTIVLMWWIRLAYFVGVSPSLLHRWYYPSK